MARVNEGDEEVRMYSRADDGCNSVTVISVMMVGHLGELSLSSTSIAISISIVTGFSLLSGMSSALETLCGQAYGAKQYKKVGTLTYTAIFSLLIVCIPLASLWTYTGSLLILMGQNSLISHEAGTYITYLIPALFAYAILQPLVRYFQMQSMLLPMLASSALALCVHIILCWALVYKAGFGNIGAAVSTGVALWSNVVFLVLYMKYSPSCAKTRSPISVEVFRGMKQFFSFAIPSAVMICVEWWSFDLNTIDTLYAITYGFAAAVSTRVSNELGAGNARGARVAVNAIMILAVVETTIVSMIVFFNRHIFGYIFTNEKEVVDYKGCMVVNEIGVARGVGWQNLGAYVNLAAFYLVGIPVGAYLGFCTTLRGEGLWIGILVGVVIQVILLSVVTFCTDYEKQATKARERLFEEEFYE
ncbi:hypothetical protein M8C21_032120 [Ambrosia artemisiifolia]|uniref:Protein DETOXIFICATION n=1 Tax=Ambrosia artemisiifolia TaxID=4212 RepID=A0AAD5C3J7_AMBAR|nr:hypothetical protein M8C21_032120 [Ambrosia artemisiifolia]